MHNAAICLRLSFIKSPGLCGRGHRIATLVCSNDLPTGFNFNGQVIAIAMQMLGKFPISNTDSEFIKFSQ